MSGLDVPETNYIIAAFCIFKAAKWRGVLPSSSNKFTSALLSIKICII
jgi:hypothetical protein